jgi:hypothetical protein
MEKESQVVEAPPEIAASIERITGEERLWFEAHPHADSYTRPASAGEFWPAFDSACVLYVIVMQVRPGFRLRAPVIRLHLPERDRVQ